MRLLLLLAYWLCTLNAQAQTQVQSLSLSEAVEQAESKNPEIAKLNASVERAFWIRREAFSGYLPKVSLGYDHFFTSEYMREGVFFGGAAVSFPAAFPQDNLTLDASWTVFDGLESWHRMKAARLSEEAAELDLARSKFAVKHAVQVEFFRTLAAQKLVEVAKQNITTLQEHLDRAHLTERSGYGTRFDVLRIEATLEEARAELEQSEGRYQDTRSALNEVMGLEKESEIPLRGDLPIPNESDLPRDLTLNPNDRDDLTAQLKREEASKEALSASRAFWYPSIALFAEEEYYKFGNFNSSIQPNASLQNASFFGIRLKWNIFDGGLSFAKQKEASAASAEAASETHKALTKLPREFSAWKRNFFQSVSLYRARSRALLQYEESVRLANVGVKAGSRTHTEMLDAELDLFRARAGLVRAQADAMEAISKLELAMGRPLR